MRSWFVVVVLLLNALRGGAHAAGFRCIGVGVLQQSMSQRSGTSLLSRRIIQPRAHRKKKKGRFAQKTPLRPWITSKAHSSTAGSGNTKSQVEKNAVEGKHAWFSTLLKTSNGGKQAPAGADWRRSSKRRNPIVRQSEEAYVQTKSKGNTPFTDLVAGAVASLALTLQLGVGFGHPPSALADYDMMSEPNQLFETQKYLGTWYEVASMKKGFAGAGQEDCHCTQGMYGVDQKRNRILVNTFCVHGSPEGKISGIQGVVKCLSPMENGMMKEMFLEECKLRFPAVPFIPAEPYDIIATDYKTYALVQGSRDKSFVQIYSRKPKPGNAFIEQKKSMLKERGFNVRDIKNTPQDCDNKMIGKMMTAMMQKEMDKAEATKPAIIKAPNGGIELDADVIGPKYLITEFKDLAKLIAESALAALVPGKY